MWSAGVCEAVANLARRLHGTCTAGRADVERARRAKIVATLGPATDGLELELVRAGLDVARLNFSHGTPADHARRCRAIRDAARSAGRTVAVMQDLQGPKIR